MLEEETTELREVGLGKILTFNLSKRNTMKQNAIFKENYHRHAPQYSPPPRGEQEPELYIPQRTRQYATPTATISKDGIMFFSASFRDMADLPNFKYCKVRYEPMTHTLFLLFGNEYSTEVIHITRAKKGSTRINLRGFFKHYDIHPEEYHNKPRTIAKRNLPKLGSWWAIPL